MPDGLPKSIDGRTGGGDFECMFGAGVCARHGLWDDLYGGFSTGLPIHRPKFSQRARTKMDMLGCHPATAWLYPPPAAPLFIPATAFRFPVALRLSFLVNGVALLVLLSLVREEFQRADMANVWTGVLTVVLGVNVPVGFNFYEQNLSVYAAVAALLVLRGLRGRGTAASAASIVFLGVTKGLSAVWVPFLLAWRRWRLLSGCVLLSAVLLAVTAILGCPWSTYREFLTGIVPASRDVSRFSLIVNESLLRALDLSISPSTIWMRAAALLPIPVVAALLVRSWRLHRTPGVSADVLADDEALCLAVSFLVFQAASGCCWKFYRVHVIAFIPLYIRLVVATRRRVDAIAFGLAMALLWIPKPDIPFAGLMAYAILVGLGFRLHLSRCRGDGVRQVPHQKDAAILILRKRGGSGGAGGSPAEHSRCLAGEPPTPRQAPNAKMRIAEKDAGGLHPARESGYTPRP